MTRMMMTATRKVFGVAKKEAANPRMFGKEGVS